MSTALSYLSLSRTLRRLAHDYKRMALEDEQAGNLERYRLFRGYSDRAWRNAKFYLNQARICR